MKKILILNPYLSTLGGGEKYTGYLCLFLEKYYSDVAIDIVVHNYLSNDVHDEKHIELSELTERFGLKLDKTRIIKQDLRIPNSLITAYINKTKAEKISSKYDIFIDVMFHSKHIGMAAKNLYLCMFPPEKSEERYRMILRFAKKYLNWRFYRSYDFFLPISEYSDYWLAKYWGESDKHRILCPPVFWESEMINNYNEASKENIILSVGRFFLGTHSKKQYELAEFFIRNIDKLHGYEFHLVGGLGHNEHDIAYVEKIKVITRDFPVFVHTNVESDELISLYRRAKVFWHASGFEENIEVEPCKAEHFGITTVEAMGYGVVPVAIRKGGQIEIVTENTGYLWESEKECVEKTVEIINNDSKRKEMAQNAFKRSFDFSVETFFENCKTLFDEIENK